MPKLKKILKKVAKYIPAVIGSVAGSAVAGPAGAVVGGSLGGASTRGKGNKLKGALKGATLGGIYSAAAPTLFSALGGAPGGVGASLTGLNSPSLLHQMGMSSAPSTGGGLGFYGNLGQKGIVQGMGGLKGMVSKVPGGKYLLPAAQNTLGKVANQKRKIEAYGGNGDSYGFGDSLINPIEPPRIPVPEHNQSQQEEAKRMHDIAHSPHLSAFDKLIQILQMLQADDPGQLSAQMAEKLQRETVHSFGESPDLAMGSNPNEGSGEFKRGGYVHGSSGGQDDDVPIDLHEGDYIMDATTVSLLGDGNSLNGAKKIKELENKFLQTGIVRNPSRNYGVRTVKAKVSPSEYRISKEVVDAAGGGDNKKGAKLLDKFRHNLRKHKGVKKFLPPKSKPILSYLGNN